MNKSVIMIIGLLAIITIISGCVGQTPSDNGSNITNYVCSDGSVKSSPEQCHVLGNIDCNPTRSYPNDMCCKRDGADGYVLEACTHPIVVE